MKMRNKQSIIRAGVIFFLVLSFVLVLNGCGKEEATALSKGEYIETVEGFHGSFDITTKIDEEGKITDIVVGENDETKNWGSVALEKLPQVIKEKQSLDVDGITGATLSSNAVINGVAAAIEKSGGNLADFGLEGKKVAPENYQLPAIDRDKLPEVAEKTGSVTVTDSKGREVEIALPVSRYAVSTMDALEYIIPLKGQDAFNMLVGSGQDGGHGLNKYAKLYTPIIGDYMEHVGQISDHNSPFDLEMILAMEPEVLIANSAMAAHRYALDVEDILEEAGIKIVLIDVPGKLPEKAVQNTMEIIGQIFQEEEKANELIEFVDEQYELIASKNLDAREDKPSVYYEFAGFSEVFGKTSTSAKGWGCPIKLAGGDNIADPLLLDTAASGGASNTLDPEYILEQNPDFIFLSNVNSLWLDCLKEQKDPTYDILNRNGWRDLKAVKNEQVFEFAHSSNRQIYSFYPALKMAKLFYPEEFVDLDPEARLNEFFDRYMLLDSDISTWFIEVVKEDAK